MSRPAQLLLLAQSVFSQSIRSQWFTSTSCRFVSKVPGIHPGARGRHRAPRHPDGMLNEEFEPPDEEDKIQQLFNAEVKRQKTVKYHILRRQMTPPGPPERKLTWEAIQEIRYLKQEHPEEWTADRLAEGFAVSKDEILRVLRSKFVPSPERKAKQDIQVVMKLKQPVLPSRAHVETEKQRLSSGSTQLVLTSGEKCSAVVPTVHPNVILQTEPDALSAVTKQPFSDITKQSAEMSLKYKPSNSHTEEDEHWDGQVLSEDNIEELITTVKSTSVVKEGNEFFDGDGNFLFRI